MKGFREGFPIGYEGDRDGQLTARNLPLKFGDLQDAWNKVVKEVKLKRFAGPFETIPFDSYIQKPIGLVSKHKELPSSDASSMTSVTPTSANNEPNKIEETRLIFHLSYPKKGTTSVNYNTPKHLCTVKYKDLDHAVKNVLKNWQELFSSQIRF